MNEIKQVIILAAGRSRRMENLSNKIPKCLFEYDNEKIICRLVRQIKKYGVEKIVITVGYRADLMKKIFADDPNVILVNNTMYEEDVNINSMNLALKHIDGPCVVFEADTIMEDSLVKYVLGSDFEGKSVWFTKGKFVEPQYGGILKSDKYGKVTDIRIIPTYQAKYKGYSKLSGLMRINKEQIELFKQYLIKQTTNQFIMFDLSIKWMEIINYLFSITMLDVLEVNAREYIKESNRIDYADFKKWRDVFDSEISKNKSFKLVNEYEINIEIFKIFNSTWKLVTSRSYDFHSYTVQELLEACNYLRDYTRGHGVFTFEISQYINLNLLKILAALANSLIYFLRITDMKDNLESLGWVIYLGDIPYFLYSVGRRDSNVTYKSFRKGNSLSLPIDIYGESDEK